MQTEKQKWVDDVLSSTDAAARAQAPDMTDAVISRIAAVGRHSIYTSNDNALIWRIAASVAFLVLLNAVTIYSYHSSIKRSLQAMDARSAASEFGLGQGSSDIGSAIFGN